MLFESFSLSALSNSRSFHVGSLLHSIYDGVISSTLSTKSGIIHILSSHSVIFTSGMLITSALLYQQDSTTTSELTPSTTSSALSHPQAHLSH